MIATRIKGSSLMQIYQGKNPRQQLFLASSGSGKTTAVYREIEAYLGNAYVISFNDAKGIAEPLATTLPEQYLDSYEKDRLSYFRLKHTPFKVKLFHPYTLNIPTGKYPKINYRTISLKKITDTMIYFLIESETKTKLFNIIKNTRNQLSNKEDMVDFLQIAKTKMTKDEISMSKSVKIALPTTEGLGFAGVKEGNVNVAEAIVSAFGFYRQHPLFQPDAFKDNIDVKRDIFDNKDELKVLLDFFIKDEKVKSLWKLAWLEEIINNSHLAKGTPIVIFWDELKNDFPKETTPFNEYLLNQVIAGCNTYFRSKNIRFIGCTQNLFEMNKRLINSNCFNEIALGKGLSPNDNKVLMDDLKIPAKVINGLDTLNYYEFIPLGIEGIDVKKGW